MIGQLLPQQQTQLEGMGEREGAGRQVSRQIDRNIGGRLGLWEIER
jgi:hypothetical protein